MTQMTSIVKKKIAIIANGKYQSKRVASKLFSVLRDDPYFYLTKKNPDIVLTIGGDGMLLSAFHMYEKQLDTVRFIGIHTGHLGFYTDYRDFEIDKLIENLRQDRGQKVSYPILKVDVTFQDGRVVSMRALNEATIKRHEKTMVADVTLSGTTLERFRGDGLTIATPTGSTAYNKSLGGAVLHPTIEALQLTEIASLNNRVYRPLGSPVVVPKQEQITITPRRSGSYNVSVDNKSFMYKNITKITFKIDRKKISFVATPNHTGFWERVRDAFIGGIEE